MVPRRPNEPLVIEEWRDITLDVSTLTLGEAVKVEQASGLSIENLARGASLRMMAMYVHGLRTYDVAPSWHELESLAALAVVSSSSRGSSDGRSARSSDSRSPKRSGSSGKR